MSIEGKFFILLTLIHKYRHILRCPVFATKLKLVISLNEIHPQGCLRGGENEHPNRTVLKLTTNANGLLTTIAECVCGKVCKNPRGLKVHQAKMKCLLKEQLLQHRDHP